MILDVGAQVPFPCIVKVYGFSPPVKSLLKIETVDVNVPRLVGLNEIVKSTKLPPLIV
jgi:hypothetical protein